MWICSAKEPDKKEKEACPFSCVEKFEIAGRLQAKYLSSVIMGNNVSTPDCFVLSQIPSDKFAELLAENFTVIRTSGEHQTGWRIPSVTHTCHDGKWSKYHAHVWDSTSHDKGVKKWRFHMVRDVENEHVCGWRYSEPGNHTFWPTRLTTDEEKEAWWAMLDSLVATLKRTREMSDAEWIPLYEAQQVREADEGAALAEALGWEEERPLRMAKIEAQRQAAIAIDPEMASRHAFWKEFDAERDRLLANLKQLRQDVESNPDLQEQLTAFIVFYGCEHDLADNLQKRMLQQKKDDAARAKMEGREHTWKILDDEETAAVARKDYAAAQRAQSQKKTARELWAEEDARV